MPTAEVHAARCLKAGVATGVIRVVTITIVLLYAPLEMDTAGLFVLLNLPAIVLALIAIWNGAIASHLGVRSGKLVLGCTLAVVSALAGFTPPFQPVVYFF